MEARLREYRAARRRDFVESRRERAAGPGEEAAGPGEEAAEPGEEAVERPSALDRFLDWLPLPSLSFTPPHMQGGALGELPRGPDGEPLLRTDSKETITSVDLTSEASESEEDIKEVPYKFFVLKCTICFVVWFMVFLWFLKIEFGAVFLVISMLAGICLNTSTKPKKRGEVSAYSVFNKNCQSINGTLNAEQFEKELRFGPGSVM